MQTVQVEVLKNKLQIPIDSPVGNELCEKADEGDEIDVTLKKWDYAWVEGAEGRKDSTVRLEIKHIFPEGGISPQIQTSELPWRIVGEFPMEILFSPSESDDMSRAYLNIDSPGYLSIEVTKLIKTSDRSSTTYVFDDSGILIPRDEDSKV